MSEVGIRALKQNASAVVGAAADGETITITDRGRPVAQLTALPTSPLDALRTSGQVRRARQALSAVPAPSPGPDLTAVLTRMREDERY